MVKREHVERIELPVHQIAYVPGAVDHCRAARRLWTATQHTVRAAADERAATAASSTSGSSVTAVTTTTAFRRLVDVPGARLEAVLLGWWARSSHDDGHLRIDRLTDDHGVFALDGSLHTSALSRRIPVEVRLAPYLGCWSLLELTPRRATHPTRTYFRVGHDSLDRFVTALCALV